MKTPSNEYISRVLDKIIAVPFKRKVSLGKSKFYLFLGQEIFAELDVTQVVMAMDVSRENYPQLVESIKYIIDWEMDKLNGFVLDMNNEMTKWRKVKYINPNNKNNNVTTNSKAAAPSLREWRGRS